MHEYEMKTYELRLEVATGTHTLLLVETGALAALTA